MCILYTASAMTIILERKSCEVERWLFSFFAVVKRNWRGIVVYYDSWRLEFVGNLVLNYYYHIDDEIYKWHKKRRELVNDIFNLKIVNKEKSFRTIKLNIVLRVQ